MNYKRKLKKLKFDFNELNSLSFGRLEGEEDEEFLSSSIVFTDSFVEVLSCKYNYVLAPKGAGKSAIFNSIEKKIITNDYFKYDDKHIIFINKAFGFDKDYLSPSRFKHDLDGKNYIFAWTLYLIFQAFENIKTKYSNYPNYSELVDKVKIVSEFKDEFQLYNILDRIQELNLTLALDVAGQQFKLSPKISTSKNYKKFDLNYCLEAINDFYRKNNLNLIILIDKVDNFVRQESYEIQKKYIQGLVDSVEEIRSLSNIQPILFLRTDLFRNLKIGLELDKVRDRMIELKWSESEILLFILRRLLSNKYLSNNFMPYLVEIYKREFELANPGLFKRLFSSNKKKLSVDLKRDLDFRICANFILLFFPVNVKHINANGDECRDDFFEWLFSHFKDKNNYINPRCLIRFFNMLFTNQYKAYRNDFIFSQGNSKYLKYKIISDNVCFDVFMSDVISKTYNTIQREQLENISMLLQEKPLKDAFKSIIQINYTKKAFRFGDINPQDKGIHKDDYSRLLKYLEICGVIYQKNYRLYSIPIIYTHSFE